MSNKSVMKVVAGFGAAMSTLYLSESAEADVVDLTSTLPASLPYTLSATFSFDLVPGPATGLDVHQYNDSLGKSFTAQTGGDLIGFVAVSAGYLITNGLAFTQVQSFGTSATGIATFGFLTNSNQVGWIRLNFGGPGGAFTYLAAAYNDEVGDSLAAGAFVAPEPGTFGLTALAGLALGATGVRRMRKRQAA